MTLIKNKNKKNNKRELRKADSGKVKKAIQSNCLQNCHTTPQHEAWTAWSFEAVKAHSLSQQFFHPYMEWTK